MDSTSSNGAASRSHSSPGATSVEHATPPSRSKSRWRLSATLSTPPRNEDRGATSRRSRRHISVRTFAAAPLAPPTRSWARTPSTLRDRGTSGDADKYSGVILAWSVLRVRRVCLVVRRSWCRHQDGKQPQLGHVSLTEEGRAPGSSANLPLTWAYLARSEVSEPQPSDP